MDLNSSSSGCDVEKGADISDSRAISSTPRKGRGRGRGRRRSISPVTPLRDPHSGDIVWAKQHSYRFWPAIVIKRGDLDNFVSLGGRQTIYYVYWYGDGRVSPIAMSNLVDFKKGFNKLIIPPGNNTFKTAVYLALKDCSKFLEVKLDDWDLPKAFSWAAGGFTRPEGSLPIEYDAVKTQGTVLENLKDRLKKWRRKYKEDGTENQLNQDSDPSLHIDYSSEEIDLIHSIRDGATCLEDICLACVSKANTLQKHPLFHGSLCGPCMEKFMQCCFSIGLDLVSYHCSICLDVGQMMVCSEPYCYRAFCNKCIFMKATGGVLSIIREADPWLCFLCEPYTLEMHGLLKPRSEWKKNVWQAFHSRIPDFKKLKDTYVRILCFDGSCDTALAVLSIMAPLGVKIEALFLCNYSDSEIKKIYHNLPPFVSVIKSVNDYEDIRALSTITPIHIVIASPQEKVKQSFGKKFFSFHNVISMLNILNCSCVQPSVPLMWVFEMAPPYWHDYVILISRYLHFDPAPWSKQIRRGSNLVWANIPSVWPFLEDESKFPTMSNPQKTKNKNQV